MSLVEPSLVRVVGRIGVDRLTGDPTLARVALKDVFPDDPLVVSLLTAAVEHGALASLRDHDDAVPLAVLGPRLARQLHLDSGITASSARWAVGAWAAALGLLERPLPEPPRDGAEPVDADLFSLPTRPPAPEPVVPSTRPVSSDDIPTVIRPAAAAASGTPPEPLVVGVPVTTGGADPVVDEDPSDLTVPRWSIEPNLETPAPEMPPLDEVAAAGDQAPDAWTPEAAHPAPFVPSPAETAETAASTASSPAPDAVAPTDAESPADDTILVSAPIPNVVAGAPAPPTAVFVELPQGTPPRRRRRLLFSLAGLVVLMLVAGGVTALVLRPAAALAVSGSADGAAWTVGGKAATVGSGTTAPIGAEVEVRSGTLALRAGDSVIRLAAGAHARVNGSDDLTLISGRAFVLADGSALTLRSTAGTARVSHGRLLGSCTQAACAVTALDAGTHLTAGSTTTTLRALEQGRSTGAPAPVFADAVRADPWFTTNDRADRSQGLQPLGLAGPSITGTWLVSLTRPDLPFALSRTITLATACGAEGCSVEVATRMSDGVPESRLSGTALPLSADGSKLRVDYGSHTVRCHWVVGLQKGQGVDGSETVSDELDFSGSGASTAVSGVRSSRYTAKDAACGSSAYTTEKSAKIAGARATPAQLTDVSLAQRWSDQQAKLNYIADQGSGCATGSNEPTADLQSDLRCSYPAQGGAPTSVEFGVYTTSSGVAAAYRSATKGLVPSGTGDCTTGPCEQVAPNGHGRFLLTKDAGDAVLITYDPRAANLLLIVHGPTMRGLSDWWSGQQKTKSVYSAFPIPRVGV